MRLKGMKGFSMRVKVSKSFVFAMPMEAPKKSVHQMM